MKTLTGKSLKALIGMTAFALMLVVAPQRTSAQSLSAQLSDREIPVTEFNAIHVSDGFEVTVARGSYGVRLTVDKELSSYIETYVKGKTLYISYDEKSVPKDIRKLYKGKKALTPVFRAVVYTPQLRSVILSDNSTLNCLEEYASDQFELTASGKSQVRNLSVVANSAKVYLKKNAEATLTLKTERGVEAGLDNSTSLKLTFTGDELAVNAEGSSKVVADGNCRRVNVFSSGSSVVNIVSDTDKVDLTTEGSSKVSLSGSAFDMTVKGSRNSSVDALGMSLETVDANLTGGSSVTVTVSRLVSVSLAGGSALYYSGTPEFKIDKIVKSTLAPYGTK